MSTILLNTSAYGIPTVFALAGLLQSFNFKNNDTRWTIAKLAALTALAMSLFTLFRSPFADEFIRSTVLILISTLASVLVWFSHTYLNGTKGHARFLSAFLFTLTSVGAAVATNHLGVLVVAWAMSSLFLHRLLTFFDDRPFAHLAARKKFIVSRLAEVCLVAFLILIVRHLGTWDISEVSARLASTQSHPMQIHVAGVFLTLAVIFKTAQLPLHGWILQVMEAPTPVSALLHAGVLNIGGYVLIRMAGLVSAVPVAQALLVGVGCTTAVVAGLVSMTRVSIKVRLAWSTCAQMGFMLVECGLGYYELALVHIVAHSLYKAHAFLSCGEVVRKTRTVQMITSSQSPDERLAFAAGGLGILTMMGFALLWSELRSEDLPHMGFLVISGLSLTPLFLSAFASPLRDAFVPLAQMLGVTAVTLFLHFHAGRLFLSELPRSYFQDTLLALVVLSFLFLAFIQMSVVMRPKGRLSRVLYPWIYGGFFIDEIFTRVTNNVWSFGNKNQGTESASEGKRAGIAFGGESSC